MSNQNIKWYGREFSVSISVLLRGRTRRLAALLEREVKTNIEITGGPSQIGSYPHQQTGQLHDGINSTTKQSGMTHEAIVTSSAPHTWAVDQIRPFIHRSLKESKFPIMRAFFGSAGTSGENRHFKNRA